MPWRKQQKIVPVDRYEGYACDKRKQLNYVLMNYSALENQNKRIKSKRRNKQTTNKSKGTTKKDILKSRDKVN